jgi:hypothetical protein
MSVSGPPLTVELTGQGVVSCPFEPVSLILADPEPRSVRVRVTEADQDLNFTAEDRPPFASAALKTPDGGIVVQVEGGSDHVHFNQLGSYGPGIYDVELRWYLTDPAYEAIQVNLACEYEAAPPGL